MKKSVNNKKLIFNMFVIVLVIIILVLVAKFTLTGFAVTGPPENAGEIPSFGPSQGDVNCMMTCMKCTSPGVGCTGNQTQCQAQCNVVKPEQTAEESCVETCTKKGCGEYDFSCQEKNQEACDKECGMIKEPEAKSEEEQCIRDCVNLHAPKTICKPSSEGEQGNDVCKMCAQQCVHLYAGPCLNEEKLESAKQECQTCDNCYGEPKMGDSGEGWECIVSVECKDASNEFGDNPGTEEGIVAKVGDAAGNVVEAIGNFFKGIFGSEDKTTKDTENPASTNQE